MNNCKYCGHKHAENIACYGMTSGGGHKKSKHWADDKPPKSLLEFREKYPHQSPYDAALSLINWQSNHIQHLTKEESRIREGYHKRIVELENLLDSSLDSLEELYNLDVVEQKEYQLIFDRAAMILRLGRER